MNNQKLTRIERNNRRFYLLGLLIVLLFPFLLKMNPGLINSCEFKSTFGLPCPTCGITRSFAAIVSGDLSQAFTYNFMGPLLVLVLITYVFQNIFELIIDHRIFIRNNKRFSTNLIILFFLLWFVYWIIRLVYQI